jgi:type IV pilus assembly protein PilZ
MNAMRSTEGANRANLRASTRVEVAIEARIDVAGEVTSCVLRNVSQGGAFADVARLAFGTQVMLSFRVPTATEVIEVAAVVRWSTADGVGLQFGGLRARDAWALGRYLEALRDAMPPAPSSK